MKRVLVTGATGNIGREVIHFLNELNQECEIIAAARDVESAKKEFLGYPSLSFEWFDFENRNSFASAFESIDRLFLLRPPHISEVEKYFQPLLLAAKESGIEEIVFLSVQGVEKSSIIPHNKIEALIRSYGFKYIFVRPGYFMQNLTTTLLAEIRENHTITLPSGHAKFNWIDVGNIGEATAMLINSFPEYQNAGYDITGTENKDFYQVTYLMSKVIGTEICFNSINPLSFYFKKRNEGVQKGFALVMTMLHFLPRFQEEPEISENFEKLTGKSPTRLADFIEREKIKMTRLNWM
ncbi:MAG: NmrA family NAD(P)-binding protein [Imperialibacter sp.]|uniref:NmrA family NAD(P)-binding protein n=1 Tax=Imperialibacter sp. TaxID=2038411 RepID=UPI0032EE83A6